MSKNVYTIGIGQFKQNCRLQKTCELLKQAGVKLVIDIRRDPCPSFSLTRVVQPKDWHLREYSGFDFRMRIFGFDYLWLPELASPQPRDPGHAMLRKQLSEPHLNWPVHRGLALAVQYANLQHSPLCLLCECSDYTTCHRIVVARALAQKVSTETNEARVVELDRLYVPPQKPTFAEILRRFREA